MSENFDPPSTEPAAQLKKPAMPLGLFQRDLNIRGVSINNKDIETLFDLIGQCTDSARQLEINQALIIADPQNMPDRAKLEAEATANFRVSHDIRDVSGRISFKGLDKPDFQSSHIPRDIVSIFISNREQFERRYKAPPRNHVEIYIDFRRASLAINFLNMPSNPTENRSVLNVIGYDEQWVVSTHQRLVEFFEQRKTHWDWLHGSGVFDALLYLVFVPFCLFKAYQIEQSPLSWFKLESGVATVGIYIYAYIALNLLARQAFMFARWLFPLVEFVSGNKWSPFAYRTVFGALVVSLIAWAFQNVISALL